MQRRTFIQHSLAGMLLSAAPNLFAKSIAQSEIEKLPAFNGWFSAQGAEQSSYGFAADFSIKQAKSIKPKRTLGLSGFRGHGGAQHPTKPFTVLMFGRRPSNQSIEVNLLTGEVTNRFYASDHRHFFGHGAFSKDGSLLFTTEADLKNNVGVIGIRDAQTYQVLGEYPTYGIGPHQIMLMPDGEQLVIANGGILTRPERGRDKLNLATMQSSLSYVNVKTGELNSQWLVKEPKSSIRHLDVDIDQQGKQSVAIAMQVQRQACGHDNLVSLAGVHRQDNEIELLEHELVTEQMQDYIGSVVIDSESRTAGFTSPRGNLVAFWNIDSGTFRGYHAMRDVCGIAVNEENRRFIVTNSYGMVHSIDIASLQEIPSERKHYQNLAWDNHMVSLRM